jgi:hypothetical protein
VEGVLKAINAEERTLTVEKKTAKGAKELSLEVAEEAGDLASLKVGDEMAFKYDSTLEVVTKIISPLSGRADVALDGFTSLFNGKDLSGWRMGPDRSWVVEDGAIRLYRKDFDGREHNSDYLWLMKPYGDFILELEFKTLDKTNSGVYLRTGDTANPVPTGIEVQVINSFGKTEVHDRSTAGAVYNLVAPSINAVKPPGEWNRLRITCKGAEIQVELNGEKIINMDLDRWTESGRNPDGTKNKFPIPLKKFARNGFIGFQDHGLPVWYRNIRIRRLSP